MDNAIQTVRLRLEAHIAAIGRVVTGFSAGVDSSVVAAAAHSALGADALAVTAVTETITPEDVELAERIALQLGLRHQWLEYSELEIAHYAENPSDRCYFCKDALYTRLGTLATDLGMNAVLDGTNADDAGDYRPGRRAANEQNVRSPLLELNITKTQVRSLALLYSLPNHDKPSAPCLSSRVPYGTTITHAVLKQIGAAERALRNMGFTELRVRHHGDLARVELPPADMPRALECASQIDSALKNAGYRFVSLDLAGFRSGSLNDALVTIELKATG